MKQSAFLHGLGVVFAAASVLTTGEARGAAGDLDPGFAGSGTVSVAFNAFSNDLAGAVTIQDDGKILVVGSAPNSVTGAFNTFAAVRFCPNGSFDDGVNCGAGGFGTGGRVRNDFGTIVYTNDWHAVALWPDGSFVTVGLTVHAIATGVFDQDLALGRYQANGTLSGVTVTNLGSAASDASGVAIHDGKILVSGFNGSSGGGDFLLARYDATGVLDGTFGSGGIVNTDLSAGAADAATGIAVQDDGKILLSGYSTIAVGHPVFALVRFCADGTLDDGINCGPGGFGTGGIVTSDIGGIASVASSLAIQDDGRIVVAGYSRNGATYDFTVVRFLDDGTPDPDFGTSGIKVFNTSPLSQNDYARAVKIAPDGKIVLAGQAQFNSISDFCIARLTTAGQLDTDFSSDGIVTTRWGFNRMSDAYGVAVQDDGKIVAAGRADVVLGCCVSLDMAVARYIGVTQPNGAACGFNVECTSSSCVDGVCCNTACGAGAADCQACSVAAGAATDGTCGPVAAGTLCRPASDACDAVETCTGAGATCPTNGFLAAGTECRASSDACDAAEACTGSSPACPADGLAAAGTLCRGSAGACDVAESCTGADATCPPDDFLAAGNECRGVTGPCDDAEVCTGSGAACPPDGFVAAGHECRGATGPCDVAESCTGSGAACPPDGFLAAGNECRGVTGPCDVAETCTGTVSACPPDGFAAPGGLCRGPAGDCDLAESCTGASAACPPDVFLSGASVCRPSAGNCDPEEACAGSGALCPLDVRSPDGTTCDDGDPCTADDACVSASCTGTPLVPCTADEPTPTGNEVSVSADLGLATVTTTFSNVTSGGTTTVTAMEPEDVGSLPGGFAVTGSTLAFEVSTTAIAAPPFLVCFQVPTINDPLEFASLRVVHGVGKPDFAAANSGNGHVSRRLGDGAGGFSAATNFAAGTTPSGVAVGDFNGDRNPDLAVTNQGSNNVSIRLGNGVGGFGPTSNHAVGSSPRAVAIADFDGDDLLDLAVANGNSNNVSVLVGNGVGGFGPASTFAMGSTPVAIVAADLNGDNVPDLATANQGSNSVSLRFGNGLGGFGPVSSVAVGTSPRSLAVSDFNGDLAFDLVTANATTNNVSVCIGNGAGGFGPATSFAVGASPRSVAVADFDRDGDSDLAVANASSNTVSIRLGNGAGGFAAATSFSVGSSPRWVAVDDFNADGNPDLAVANGSSNSVSIRLGNGAGGFAAATSFSVGTTPVAVATGNFNRDAQLVDQTVLSGPNAPDFATRTICASVQSLSPFVLAAVHPYAIDVADVSVASNSPYTNFGTTAYLEASSSFPTKRTYLKIHVDNVDGRQVTSARLLLKVSSRVGADSGSKGRLRATSCGWNETTLRWGSSLPALGVVVSAPSGAARFGDTVAFDLTAAIAGDGDYCFALEAVTQDPVAYSSREAGGSAAPEVVLEVGP